jgi:hypothetical protein
MVLALVLLPALSDLLGGKRDVDPSGFGLASWLAPGVSFALGAFFAGMILAESLLSQGQLKRHCRSATPSRFCSSSPSACSLASDTRLAITSREAAAHFGRTKQRSRMRSQYA